MICGDRHLRHLVREFVAHYLGERYHQGIGGELIAPALSASNDNATLAAMACHSRLGGVLNFYFRHADTCLVVDQEPQKRALSEEPSASKLTVDGSELLVSSVASNKVAALGGVAVRRCGLGVALDQRIHRLALR